MGKLSAARQPSERPPFRGLKYRPCAPLLEQRPMIAKVDRPKKAKPDPDRPIVKKIK
jgi:hypothetical protein